MKKIKLTQLKITTNNGIFDVRSPIHNNIPRQNEQLMNNLTNNYKTSICNQIIQNKIKNKSFHLGEKNISTNVNNNLKNPPLLSSSNLNSINSNLFSNNLTGEKPIAKDGNLIKDMKKITTLIPPTVAMEVQKRNIKMKNMRMLSPLSLGEHSIEKISLNLKKPGENGYKLNGNSYINPNGGNLSTKMNKKLSFSIFNKSNNNTKDNGCVSNTESKVNAGKIPNSWSKSKISNLNLNKVSVHKSFEVNMQTSGEGSNSSASATQISDVNNNSSVENQSMNLMANLSIPLNPLKEDSLNIQLPSTPPSQIPELISVCSLINNQNIPLSLSNLSAYFSQYESTKCSTKPIGNIRAYGANTYQGIIRNYNEDRVSIILNIAKPPAFKGTWPKCSIFGIYDGHGGSACGDFLRDQLHTYIIKDPNFPINPKEALIKGFEHAEKDYISNYATNHDTELLDKSGSCAVVALIIDDMCYIANVGDSRALLSLFAGKNFQVLTSDHKPNEEAENKRIIDNGGKVYQTQTPTRIFNLPSLQNSGANQILVGPYRVFPGRLSVSRTFGDVEAKVPKFGGVPGVVIATPDISVFKITSDTDFLLMGCDGIFDQLSNSETIDCVWMTMKNEIKAKNLHTQCALAIDMIMKSSLVRRTLDNVTVLLVAFENFENIFKESNCNCNCTKPDNNNISPKSSFYLCNVIENKETDSCSPHYMNTEPNSAVNTISEDLISKAAVVLPRKSLSPKSKKDFLTRGVRTRGEIMNNLKSLNINDSHHMNLNVKRNKMVSFEDAKKIVLSPKSKKILKNGGAFPGGL